MTEYTKLENILDALSEASDFLDNYADVLDGDYGEPRPNWAMRVKTLVDEAIEHAVRMRARIKRSQ